MSKNIKAVVFDFGGVIRLNDNENILERIAQTLGVPIADLKKTYWAHNHLSNVQNMKWEDMIMEVVRMFDKSAEMEHRIKELIREHEAGNRTNTELLAFLPVLRRAGLKVAILSNATSELRTRLEQEGIALLVDEIVVSGEIGYQKPHKEAFDVCFKKLGIQPQEVIFVDDSPKSLETAGEIGYIPILFKNNEQLKTELKKLGVLWG